MTKKNVPLIKIFSRREVRLHLCRRYEKKSSSVARLPLFGGVYINKDFSVYYNIPAIYIYIYYIINIMCIGIVHVVFVLLWNII